MATSSDEHHFRAESGGTRVLDRVEYRTFGGRPIERLLVRPDLERIFRYRERMARARLSARASKRGLGQAL